MQPFSWMQALQQTCSRAAICPTRTSRSCSQLPYWRSKRADSSSDSVILSSSCSRAWERAEPQQTVGVG